MHTADDVASNDGGGVRHPHSECSMLHLAALSPKEGCNLHHLTPLPYQSLTRQSVALLGELLRVMIEQCSGRDVEVVTVGLIEQAVALVSVKFCKFSLAAPLAATHCTLRAAHFAQRWLDAMGRESDLAAPRST